MALFLPLCGLPTVEVVVDLGGIVVLYGDRGVVQHGQQVLLHVPYLGGVLSEAVEHEADVFGIQLQQPGLYHCLGKIVPRHPDIFLFRADRLHHLVQLTSVIRMLPHKIIVADILRNQFPIGVHLVLAHPTASVSRLSFRFRRLCRRRCHGRGRRERK